MATDRFSIQLKLDHFKVYKQYNPTEPRSVRVQGQFDKIQVPAKLDHMDYFANPVSKNGSQIINKQAHLAFYSLTQKREPRRIVILRNQFGIQKLLLGRPVYLLVPSEKIERGSTFPKRLDHFKAYQVLEGQDVSRKVSLVDQIDKQKSVEVDRPEYFCVPVTKLYGKKPTRITNPKGHLTFYSITPKVYKVPKESKDQFGRHKLLLATSVFLGVPTLKIEWEAIG